MIALAAKSTTAPYQVPAGFVLTSTLFLMGAVLLLALHPDGFSSYRHPVTLAFTHLLLLGFGTGILIGSMHQLVPVILEVGLVRAWWGYAVLGLWAVGVPIQVFGFLQYQPVLIAMGGGLVSVALIWFAVHMFLVFRSTRKWSVVATSLVWVTLHLLTTPAVGMLQALSMQFGNYDPVRLQTHAVLGLVGVFLISIAGVGHKLVGMFTLSHGVKPRVLGLNLWVLNIAILSDLIWPASTLPLLLLAALLMALDAKNLIAKRVKKQLDVGVRHYVLGMGFLVASILLALGGLWTMALTLFAGFLLLVITGMLYKILPFLVWLHRYADQVGKTQVPTLKDMFNEKTADAAMVIFALGIVATVFHPAGLWLIAAGLVPYLSVLTEVMYVRRKP
ncbi:hypothetical protein [Deinococcus cellulosilyticus]|uniref:Uncharacterized protein n=1 Tax=Deinococcus cellulosilyticus (strain DSM 18568 / NBRC 106333 / KACC 11606 / 5516J-15) TaxID=1223518 RepID=A0A511MY59_DEIC1|nr:hypothetical protein [Deinococcus cellulosilyticus]GEM45522.1 hypothetical protein DC3_11570 [Deinococcus cellulosilyticus NBRC 106333 = KACC 11606]